MLLLPVDDCRAGDEITASTTTKGRPLQKGTIPEQQLDGIALF